MSPEKEPGPTVAPPGSGRTVPGATGRGAWPGVAWGCRVTYLVERRRPPLARCYCFGAQLFRNAESEAPFTTNDMSAKLNTITNATLATQVKLDFTTEQDTSTLVVDRRNALWKEGVADPDAAVCHELLVITSKLTRNGKASWSKIATYAFLGGWTWDSFNAAMKEAIKIWHPEWDAIKRSRMQACWSAYRYDPDLWNQTKKQGTKSGPSVATVKRKAEALLEELDALKAGVKKGKAWTDAKALLRAIGREGK